MGIPLPFGEKNRERGEEWVPAAGKNFKRMKQSAGKGSFPVV